ncbi:hypothetical protein L286_14060 [Sphingobium sp. HDIP04]|nr:hypothetical protein L286_14060 [Sphingobium sp. HDIP04]
MTPPIVAGASAMSGFPVETTFMIFAGLPYLSMSPPVVASGGRG